MNCSKGSITVDIYPDHHPMDGVQELHPEVLAYVYFPGSHSRIDVAPVTSLLTQFGKQDDVATGQSFVLVVDDDPHIRSIVTDVLEYEGYEVAQAADGAEALSIIERVRPRVVLLDMRMPVMNGWTFAEQLRERGVEIPIVVMTAATDARQWAIEIHAQGYLAKPFDLIDLLTAVSKISSRN